MTQMEKIHIWIGSSQKTEDEFNEYFELDYSTEGDFDDPKFKICQFCKDIDQKWYDEDFIGILPFYAKEISVAEILKNDIPINSGDLATAVEECNKLGIKMANAVFYLTDAEVVIKKPYKENYNGLKYIGMYNSSLE
jgi:hypothetical protein